ncbi:hypothetical protein SAMN05421743_12157 [Thalassobacillus cyri]|uniref:Uncharacterized protein n=1 Tax=Thalassobacillus cyri TaxID=571932 RepID=A0A1H4H472_9BACI|nr:hypothetical protein [Thalassobacillus cyri]SEB15878.1 hypothetical protein SAMN05421743_12157 [Thalassobacillus cyri]
MGRGRKLKLADFTVEEYVEYKKQKLSDDKIRKKLDCSKGALYNWKLEHGMIGKHRIYRWEVEKPILADFTPEKYFVYKKRGYSDDMVATLCNCSVSKLMVWKKENGLTLHVRVNDYASIERHLPEKIKKKKEKFLRLYNQYLSHEAIAEEMGMGRASLTRFKKRYFPELCKRQKPIPEHLQREAKENGITVAAYRYRIYYSGMTPEQAVSFPLQKVNRPRDEKGRFVAIG